ncbi:MAG: hypothetical protein JJ992_04395, partial [Planctomycetes bacterium]|nr:hypothetical protein [Planctomycetota bacterium]
MSIFHSIDETFLCQDEEHELLVSAKHVARIVPAACLPRRDEPSSNQFCTFGSGHLLGSFYGIADFARQWAGTVKPGLAQIVRSDGPDVQHHSQHQRCGDGHPDTEIPPRATRRQRWRRDEFAGH